MRSLSLLLVGFAGGMLIGVGSTAWTAAEAADPPPEKVGDFSKITIHKKRGSRSALDLHTDEAKALRIFIPVWPAKDPPVEQTDPVSYFAAGVYFTKGWV
ncbi:MAG TPA: hypothetical protein VJ739_04770, partial [Gemmataceae bacterium]|nr:hypothetical protein [Gemmataceae bacterium]